MTADRGTPYEDDTPQAQSHEDYDDGGENDDENQFEEE
jgi:hypothetical protein